MNASRQSAQPTRRTAASAFGFGVVMTVLGVWMLVGGVRLGEIVIDRDVFFGSFTLAAGALSVLVAVKIALRYAKQNRQ